jgi:hypothetical protein
MNNTHLQLKIFNALFVLFVISIASVFLIDLFTSWSYTSWQISEFLINYQGGFVRRGLTGEILFILANFSSIDIVLIIKILSVICCGFVCGFFTQSFLKKGYSLYLLPLCFFCGGIIMSQVWIRKDFLMFCFFIPIIWVYANKTMPIGVKWAFINLLSIVMILNHEVFAIFTLPILFLLSFYTYYKQGKGIFLSGLFSFFILLPSIFAFLWVSVKHGDPTVAQAIYDSWDRIAPGKMEKLPYGNAIDAIGWTGTQTLLFHFNINFLKEEYYLLSIWYWLVTVIVIYYISVNTFLVFQKQQGVYTREDRNNLSALFCFQFLCLLPMFLALSIDYIRIFFYLTASSFALFLIVPKNILSELFPKFWKKSMEAINAGLDAILPPSRTTLALLMLIVGVSYSGFVLKTIWMSTMIYRIFLLLSEPILLFRDYIFH